MLEKHFFGEKKENNESFDLSNEVNLLKKDGDPRKKSYVLRLALESREYWHKFVGDGGKSYSPSIFRLFENEGLLDKKEDRTRKYMAPEHIITVMMGCEALYDQFSEKITFLKNDKQSLILAAALHDVNKDIEFRAVKLTQKDEALGYGQAGYDLASDVSEQKLKFAGVPKEIIDLHNVVGHASCPKMEDILKNNFAVEEIIKTLILHYVDDIVSNPNIIDPAISLDENGNRLNALDRRCIQNEKNSNYLDYNLAWKKDKRNLTGETAFAMQRRVGHLVEKKIADILGIDDPLALPAVIYKQIQKNIQEHWDKNKKE